MKKVYLFISLMLSALAMGCNNAGTTDDQPVNPGLSNKNVVTVNATLPGDLKWEAGDQVAINGLESNEVTEEGAGSATYAFSVSDVEAPLVVSAPFEVLTGLNEVSFPATQQYVADGMDRTAYGMVGIAPELVPVSEEENAALTADVELVPLMGIVSLPLTLDSSATTQVLVKRIAFTAESGAALNGSWQAEPVTNTDEAGVVSYDIKLTGVENSATTNLDCGDGVEINTSAPVYFNLVVPAGTYTGGFEVVVTDTEEHNYILELSEDITVERGAQIELAPSTFVVVEKAPATLTVTINEPGVVWQDGDAVVCNNELSPVVAQASVGTQTATFNFEAVAYPYSVFYPAEYYTTSGSLRFYDEQALLKNSYDHSQLVMAGYSTTTEVTLNNLCGIISIPVTNKYEGETITVDKIVVTTAEGDPISGKYHINYRTGALTSVSGKSEITLIPNEGEFTIAPEETATVNFVVPKGNIRNGLFINIYSSVGLLENHKVFPTGLTVRGGETSTADVYEYKEVKIEKIMTAEELIDFAKCVNMGRYKKFVNEEGKVVLGGDIDMASVAVEAWPMIAGTANEAGLPLGFDGIFDGCGFAIKNWATSQPLFHTLAATGKIMNVNIDASCALNMPQEGLAGLTGGAAIAFLVAHNLGGEISGCTNNADVLCNAPENPSVTRAALIGYSLAGSNIRDCANYGNVTIDMGTHGAGTGYIGTVSGRFTSSPETIGCGVFNCKNYGALTINVASANTANLYIGAVTGSSNSYTVTEGCENYGALTFNSNNSGAAVCLGGITSYSAGEIKNCINEGNVTFKSTAQLKGTIAAGIAPYQNGPISGCTNKGEIYMEGGIFGGRNTVGSISTSAATSTAAPTAAGVVGYGYSSSGSPFSMDNCHNYGKVTYNWFETDGSGTSGRTQVAGVIGSPWGDVTNCNNYGDVTFIAKYKNAIDNHLSYIGGIAGSDYYAKSQSESSIINCVNEGNITIDCDCGTSNNAAGGIIGWPGKESACTNVTENCVNKGNIVVSGEGKFRLGGIQGGSGIIKGCTNEGSITINSSNSGSNYGGLAGFHSGGYELIDSTNTGDIVCNVPISGGGIAGMAGNLGNSAHAEGKIKNNTIKCLVKSVEGVCGVGMVVGHFNGNAKTIYFGTADEPIKVGGSLQIGETTTVIDATNCNDPAVLGNGCTNYSATAHIFNCVLAQ